MAGDRRSSGRRVAVLLEYDGTAYCGSQYQENGPSIQAELEAAVKKLTGVATRAAFAGRTDAGVHALGQVAAFDTDASLPVFSVVSALNHYLPPDIAVRSAADVEPGFDPRRDARNRVYRYRMETQPVRSPLRRERVWHVGRELDVGAMQRVARELEGAHDFAAFAAPYDGLTHRTLRRCEVSASCSRVTLEMESLAFLPHQVRRTAGILVEAGLARKTHEEVTALLHTATPSSAGPAAPACGLYLVRIEYDGLAFEPASGNGRDA